VKTPAPLLSAALCLLAAVAAPANEPVRLANNPALSPDGKTLAFDWNGDVWTVPVAGGVARPLTQHPGRDREPKFSPDGKEIAFVSDRDGSPQVYVMPADGGTPRQLTYHTAGFSLQDWLPDGRSLLVSSSRDHYWRHAERFFIISKDERRAEQFVFDDFGSSGVLSPDGKTLLFTREGPAWWRKGYKGSQASQVWLYDLGKGSFGRVLDHEAGCRWPLWRPDDNGFYYVGAQGGSFNLRERDLQTGTDRPLTQFKDDSVVFPCISRDGSTIVFRHLFDLYSLRPGDSKAEPKRIDITCAADRSAERKDRRILQTATQVAFSADGLEVAFIAGGDLWVMDTELREPRQVTATPEEERSPVFAPDGEGILFVSDKDGQSDIYKAARADKQRYWWQNERFNLERLTNDAEIESNLKWSPEGSLVAFIKGRGDLWVMNADGKDARRVLASWSAPEYDWSPDGKWLVFARYDNDFNRDIWLLPADASREPFNLSRHPFNEGSPVWSPDGKVIAFTGRRAGEQTDIYFVWLREEDDEKDTRDRTLEKALDKINKARTMGPKKPEDAAKPDDKPAPGKKGVPEVAIDFEKIHKRIRRVVIADTAISGLFWSPDSKKLAFTATLEDRRGTYTIDIPDDLKPKLLTTQTGTQARWLKQGNQVVWLSGGVPGSVPGTPSPAAGLTARAPAAPTNPTPSPAGRGADAGSTPGGGTSYRFQALQEVDLPKKNAAVFDLCWRTMRDSYYDERLGNRDWDAVRRKYSDMAAEAPDNEALETVVNLMLGELNGSHLGFYLTGGRDPLDPGAPPAEVPAARKWNIVTPHLGMRFDPSYKGPGLKVRDVLPNGPAEHKKGRIAAGDIIVSIDGVAVDPAADLTTALNGPLARDIHLKVKDAADKEREVTLRPITYAAARQLLYEKWIDDNRKAVDQASKGAFGYLHIAGMNLSSFHRFEEELYSVGAGKDGLVIDVRENGGGSTADHLLTALSQPVHAVTVPRGGGPGYPQDRKVYATWNKPIVVLCNQNSFSNAEIFSHAVKTLRRGPLVGVPTAGGVISTGGTAIMDVGFLRLPFRGWFLTEDGKDMELNGCVPHHVVWPEPGDLPRGKDAQLEKAVAVLQGEVEAWKQKPRPPLHKASEP
jgi:tricorn protease